MSRSELFTPNDFSLMSVRVPKEKLSEHQEHIAQFLAAYNGRIDTFGAEAKLSAEQVLNLRLKIVFVPELGVVQFPLFQPSDRFNRFLEKKTTFRQPLPAEAVQLFNQGMKIDTDPFLDFLCAILSEQCE